MRVYTVTALEPMAYGEKGFGKRNSLKGGVETLSLFYFGLGGPKPRDLLFVIQFGSRAQGPPRREERSPSSIVSVLI